MSKFRSLLLERLDDRRLLAAFGIPWPEASSLSISFAPDGTAAGQQSSALFKSLSGLPDRQWEQEILRAFQTWAVAAGINLGVVADGGQAFGTTGLKQGDSRFGDIRIGALAMDGDVLAVANPFDPFVANTSVGDVYLNSSVQFSVGGKAPGYDLFSVMLHEAGHVLGLDHSQDPSSAMFENFQGVRTGLSAADVAAVQSLYKQADDSPASEASHGTRETATVLDFDSASGGRSPAVLADGDIAAPAAGNYYRLDVPAASQGLEIRVKAAGISLLVPQLTVYDAAGAVVASAVAVDPLSNDLKVSIDRATPGHAYYLKVAAGRSDVFGVGRYQLEVDANPTAGPPTPPTPQNGGTGAAAGSGGSPLGNAQLLVSTPGYVEHTYYEIAASLNQTTPQHVYQVRSADIGPDLTNVMTIAVHTSSVEGDPLQLSVLDDQGAVVASQPVFAGPGQLEIQVSGVVSNRDYFVRVTSDPRSSHQTDIHMDVDFSLDTGHRQPIAAGLLDSSQKSFMQDFSVAQGEVLHLSLAASHWNTDRRAALRMTILDTAGRPVFGIDVADGASRSADVFLNHGRYQLRFERSQGDADTPLRFELMGLAISDPIGPQLRDATRAPLPSASASALVQLNFYWQPAQAANAGLGAASGPLSFQSALGNGSGRAAEPSSLALPPTGQSTISGFGVMLYTEPDLDNEITDDLPSTRNPAGADGDQSSTSGGTAKPSTDVPGSRPSLVPADAESATDTATPLDAISVQPRHDAQLTTTASAASTEFGSLADAAVTSDVWFEFSDEELGLFELACLLLATHFDQFKPAATASTSAPSRAAPAAKKARDQNGS